MSKSSLFMVALLVGSMMLAACAAPTPEVLEQTVEITKIVEGTPETVIEEKVVTATPQPTPEQEKELVVVQGTEPWTLDMGWVNAQVIMNVGNHINERLLEYDPSMEMKPHLAVSWEQIEPTVWQYKLREGVRFSNGEPFNAEQVKFSFDRVMAPESDSMRKTETRYVSEVEVVDDYTVNFHTDGVVPLFDLYTLKFNIVPKGYITENGREHFAQSPIGTGPFVLDEWVKDDHITLRKNPDYWGPEPEIDVLTFRAVPDIASRVATLLAGEADIVTDLQPATVAEVEKRANLTVEKRPEMRIVFFNFNTRIDTPLKDRRVRQAMNYGVDKDLIIDKVLDGYGKKLKGQVVSPEYWGFNPDLEAYPYDPDKAKELLAEAGYPDGFDVRLITSHGRYMMDSEVARAVAGQLKDIGVNVDVNVVEWGVHQDEYFSYEGGPMFILGFMSVPDATRMLSLFQSTDPNAQGKIAGFDEVISAAISETDKDERLELVQEALDIFREEAPVLFLHQQYILWGMHDRIQNFEAYPNGRIRITPDVDVSGSR
jgi:peptide/nickel transport system substrate-binding protein